MIKKLDKSKLILNIGVLPLPLGGVTIHLKRLMYELRSNELNKYSIFYDYKKESLIIGIKKFLRSDIVHIHFSNKYLRLFVILLSRALRKKCIITFHGKYSFKNFLDYLSLKFSTISLVLNNYSYDAAVKKLSDHSKIKLISAFIPPTSEEGTLSIETDIKINKFIAKFDIVACTNAHNYVLDINGEDLYGIGFLLDYFSEHNDVGLIVCDPSGNLLKNYKKFSISKNVLFITKPEPFVEVIKKSNFFIRATTTDGDSLSIKEALYYGIKTIVTNCVDRPAGCYVFRKGDKESLKKQIFNENLLKIKTIENGALQIIELYNKI
ncbi:MAG: glycosyltransferase [Flavobacterium sp.]